MTSRLTHDVEFSGAVDLAVLVLQYARIMALVLRGQVFHVQLVVPCLVLKQQQFSIKMLNESEITRNKDGMVGLQSNI